MACGGRYRFRRLARLTPHQANQLTLSHWRGWQVPLDAADFHHLPVNFDKTTESLDVLAKLSRRPDGAGDNIRPEAFTGERIYRRQLVHGCDHFARAGAGMKEADAIGAPQERAKAAPRYPGPRPPADRSA
jgi:hypothetical protein